MRVFAVPSRELKRAVFCAAPLIYFAPCLASETDHQPVASPIDFRTVVFSSVDAGDSTFANLGAKHTFGGSLDETGPVGMATVGYGGTVERAWWLPDRSHVIRHAVQASALFGHQWVRDGLVVAAFAGPELESDGLSRRILPSLGEPHLGVRLHGEVWAHPTTDTLFTTTAVFGTARTAHFWGRVSAGYAIWDGVFVGPEASVYTTDTYREWRLGAHVTGLTLGRLDLRLSGGWRAEEEAHRQGGYVGLSAHIKM